MTIIWNEAEIGGRKCASIHFEQKRLYVVERFGKVEAWIDGVRVGSYADLPEAKEAILKIRRPKLSPARYITRVIYSVGFLLTPWPSGGSDANGDAGHDKMPNSNRNVMPLQDQHKPN